MTQLNSEQSIQLGNALPELRRFARALCGSQQAGDAYAAATLEAVLADNTAFGVEKSAKVVLFGIFASIWRSSGAQIDKFQDDTSQREDALQERLSVLTPQAREALLLRLLEDFSFDEIGDIMNMSAKEAAELVEIGTTEIETDNRSRVLIIEDEPLIAMDISAIVEGLGHDVIAVARTHSEAVNAVADLRPDLILADVRLADGSSGIEAVDEILGMEGEIPVIFITAFPHRLLTGERREPAYVVTKPFQEHKLKALIDQAVFFKMPPNILA